MSLSRRTFLAGATATAGALFLPLQSYAATSETGESGAPSYADNVNFALEQNPDHWGEQLLAWRDGPTFDNIQSILKPANIASRYVTESGWYYLPFTDRVYDPATWLQERDFAIHVADGSQITAQYCWATDTDSRQWVTFQVGAKHEVYGSTVSQLAEPRLWGGYLPILNNSYTDASGTQWDRESFAARVSQSTSLISFIHFTVRRQSGPTNTVLRLYFHVDDASTLTSDGTRLSSTGNYYLFSSATGSWSAPYFDIPIDLSLGVAEIYLAVLNTPAPATGFVLNAATYQQVKQTTAAYWTNELSSGASVSVPEPYAMDAMRNLLLQNLVMSWQQSIANGYETGDPGFAFVPEVSTSVAALGEFGFLPAYKANLRQLLTKGQGPDTFPNWEKGIRLQSAANYFFLSNDADYILENLPTFQGYLNDFKQQRAVDPNGLLEKERYGSDIPQPVYGVHHQSEAWRGMRDMGVVLNQLGRAADATPFLTEAAALRESLVAAIQKSSHKLSDGALYVPISLIDPDAPAAYPQITATRDGSYWNLVMPYALATGIFPPGSDEANGLLRYILQYGGMFLGLLRFNESGINPPGTCESGAIPPFPPAAAGYQAPGVDEQYCFSLLKFLGNNGQADRLVLAYYGKLAQDLTPYTFIGGEGTTISPCPDLPENLRSQWFPPLSANNAVYLRALRELLIHEDLDDNGVPQTLHITPATPRGWLAPGKRIDVRDLPTLFGPVTFSLVADAQGTVTATVQPPAYQPGRVRPANIVLHIRTPAGDIGSTTVNGASAKTSGNSVALGAPGGTATIVAHTSGKAPSAVDSAQPTVVFPDRLLFQPGDTVPLRVTVEALGAGAVAGTVAVHSPNGWPAPSTPFSVPSSGHIGWQAVDVPLTIPRTAAPGNYDLTVTASPNSGRAGSRTLTLQIAVPVAQSYAQLVQTAAPTGYWRLGEHSGTQAGDSSGHGGTGSYQGTVTLGQPGAIADDPDGAVRLVDGYVDVPNSPSVTLTGPFTLEAWIKVISADQQGIIEKYGDPTIGGYLLRTVQANKLFAQTLPNTTPPPPGVSGPTTVLPPLWHHVAAVFDGATLTLYLDGAVESSVAHTVPPTAGPTSLKLGAQGNNASQRLNGWLDEVAIYPHPLSVDQLRSHYIKGVLGNPR